MKTAHFKIIVIFFLIYITSSSSFSTVNMISLLQPLERSFSWFRNNRICPFLTTVHLAKDGRVKPMALISLPKEYYLHESIPREYRPFFYVAADAWNMKLREDVIRISSEIDRNPINTEHNRLDQKSVIYLVDGKSFQEISTDFNQNQLTDTDLFLPGLSRNVFPKIIDESLPFLPIVETDMMIREEALTDLEYYRYSLIRNLQQLGVEVPLFDVSIGDLRRMVFFHLENITVEKYRSLVLENLEKRRDTINSINSTNLIKGIDSKGLDQDIEDLRSMESERVRFFKYDGIIRLLNVDIEMMETQSSTTLVNTITHEMGHGLGLPHIPPRPDVRRPLMEESTYNTLNDLTIPKEIGSYAFWGVHCLYRDILSSY